MLLQLLVAIAAAATCVNGLRLPRWSPRSALRSTTSDDVAAAATVKKNRDDGTYSFDYWRKAFVSQPEEFDYDVPASDIDGQVPPDLVGTLFRNRPGLFERGEQNYGHYLDGDGKVLGRCLSSQTPSSC
jgi:hypothetical protein